MWVLFHPSHATIVLWRSSRCGEIGGDNDEPVLLLKGFVEKQARACPRCVISRCINRLKMELRVSAQFNNAHFLSFRPLSLLRRFPSVFLSSRDPLFLRREPDGCLFVSRPFSSVPSGFPRPRSGYATS